jgi:pyruvate dehydrogenase E1 component beta subunit
LTARHEVPLDDDYLVELGSAALRRSGEDVTVVAIGRQVDRALEAAERVAGDGVSAEVIDPRTLSPLDRPAITESVRRTGRLVVVQDATSPCSFAAEICALAAETCLSELKTEPVRVTAPFINVPTPVPLAEARTPDVDDIASALRACAGKG